MKRSLVFLSTTLAFCSLTFASKPVKELTHLHNNFTGFYFGLGTGVQTLLNEDSFTTRRASGLGGDQGTNYYTYTSIAYLAQLGYGKEFSNKRYVGLEGMITYAPIDTLDETGFSTATGNLLIIGNNSIHSTSYPTFLIDAVFGRELAPRFLPFLEVGVSFGKLRRNYTVKRTRTNIATRANVKYEAALPLNKYSTGFDIGIGARRLVGEHFLISSKIKYTYFSKVSNSVSVAIPGSTDIETHSRSAKNFNLSFFGTLSYLY